jgi:hypothetical protein
MKVGDLVRIAECVALDGGIPLFPCKCAMCDNNSTRVGLVVGRVKDPDFLDLGLQYIALFDIGEVILDRSPAVTVISKTRT